MSNEFNALMEQEINDGIIMEEFPEKDKSRRLKRRNDRLAKKHEQEMVEINDRRKNKHHPKRAWDIKRAEEKKRSERQNVRISLSKI